jgi:hypothetical protein
MRRGNIVFNNGSHFLMSSYQSPVHLFPKLVYMTAEDDFFVQRPNPFLSLSSLCAAYLFKLTGERGVSAN